MSASVSRTWPVPGPTRAAGPDFEALLGKHGFAAPVRGRVTTLQINVGKLCNQACHHCHVEAGPKRTEVMSPWVAERALSVLAASPGIELVDITGGAPELCPSFRRLVTESRRLGRRVIDRCNLTILFEAGQEDLAGFLAENKVGVVASLPCYLEENVDGQRGRGVFKKSIDALQRLNALGYGRRGAGLELDLVYNPLGPYLPPQESRLEADYKRELLARYGIEFDCLLAITNMPIRRFAELLQRSGEYEAYMGLLVNHFNPAAVPGLMCRSLVSVGWDGLLYDCDFNQMLEMPLGAGPRTLFEIDSLDTLAGARIATGSHCFGCTAGAGSSCGGSVT
ncbi:MAG: arsenosugar biosynthesis radical SAM protein ArsS [Planctomycetes bacterium]|nr:arsenosugar biosynthesis radical SAM protein ArsS [Planctomycetota bacterium]